MRREHRLGRVVSLDPNVRPSLIGNRGAYLRRLAGWLSVSDIVKVSLADLGWLYPSESPEDVAQRWLASGPVLVVVSRGQEGATSYSSTSVVTVPSVATEVVDTVGVGDAFTAGMLGRLHERNLMDRVALEHLSPSAIRDCLEHANRVAAFTCRRAGAEPPYRDELGASSAD
jgi:fructokinase